MEVAHEVFLRVELNPTVHKTSVVVIIIVGPGNAPHGIRENLD